jgi:hypothetical protein
LPGGEILWCSKQINAKGQADNLSHIFLEIGDQLVLNISNITTIPAVLKYKNYFQV